MASDAGPAGAETPGRVSESGRTGLRRYRAAGRETSNAARTGAAPRSTA